MAADQERKRAQQWVIAQCRKGLKRPDSCSKCDGPTPKPYAYHPDPSLREDYVWLCRLCYCQFVPPTSPKINPETGAPYPPKGRDINRALPDFETLQRHFMVEKLTFREVGEMYGISSYSASKTWKRRCQRRGISSEVPGHKEKTIELMRQANRKFIDEKTISAVSTIAEIRECSELFDLPCTAIMAYVGDKRPALTRSLLSGRQRLRMNFKQDELYQEGLARLRAEYWNYPQKKAEVRERAKALILGANYLRFNVLALSRIMGVKDDRLSRFIYEDSRTISSFTLEQLGVMEAALYEWEAWLREMERNELSLRATRPRKDRKQESAPSGMA